MIDIDVKQFIRSLLYYQAVTISNIANDCYLIRQQDYQSTRSTEIKVPLSTCHLSKFAFCFFSGLLEGILQIMRVIFTQRNVDMQILLEKLCASGATMSVENTKVAAFNYFVGVVSDGFLQVGDTGHTVFIVWSFIFP